jgi:hypothetical protein
VGHVLPPVLADVGMQGGIVAGYWQMQGALCHVLADAGGVMSWSWQMQGCRGRCFSELVDAGGVMSWLQAHAGAVLPVNWQMPGA